MPTEYEGLKFVEKSILQKPLIIFDLDGTLFRTDEVFVQAFRSAAAELGMQPPDEDDLIRLIGLSSSDCIDVLSDGSNRAMTKQLMRSIGDYEMRLIPEIGRVFDGVPDILSYLDACGFQLAICSRGSCEYIELVLKTCGISEAFSIIKGHERGLSKSDQVGSLIKEHRPSFAIMVGDREADLIAARNNDIAFIGASYGYGGDEILQADYLVETALDIRGIISRYDMFDVIRSDLLGLSLRSTIVVGINGIDASGKTKFAAGLAHFLERHGHRVQVVHLDDFLNESRIRKKGVDPVQSYIDNAFNVDMLIDIILKPIRRGERVQTTLRHLDLETDLMNRDLMYDIDSSTVIIIEGVLLYRQPLDKYFDYRIFLDIPFEEMVRRAEIRDVPRFGEEFLERYEEKYIPIQRWYLAECDPVSKSNVVIDNSDYNKPRLSVTK